MKKISTKTTREELVAIIVKKLSENKIEAVLVGGSVVSIYTANRYESYDLDFISPAEHRQIANAMAELGFTQKGKDFIHANSKFSVEFPTGPLGIGDDQPIKAEGKLKVDGVNIALLSPTQSVMDRLAWFFYSNDRQCLDQAIWVSEKHPVNIKRITDWASREGQLEKLQIYLKRVRKNLQN